MSNEPEPITQELYAKVISEHKLFFQMVVDWITDRGESMQTDELNVFSEILCQHLKRASAMMHGDLNLMKTRHWS